MVDLGVTDRLRNLTYGLTLASLAAVAFLTGSAAATGETAPVRSDAGLQSSVACLGVVGPGRVLGT